MKQFILPFLFICILFAPAKSQDNGTVFFEPTIEAIYFWPNQQVSVTTGFESTFWLAPFIGVNTKLKLGYDTHHGFTFMGGWEQALSSITIIELPGAGGVFLGVLALVTGIVPAGVTFAINPDENVVVMPYLHFLEMQNFRQDPDTKYRCSGSAGVKLHIALDNGMAICPRVGMKYIYGKHLPGVEVGIGLNIIPPDY